jgi:hypothetical protein
MTHYAEGYYPTEKEKGQMDLRLFVFDRALDGEVNVDVGLIEATHIPKVDAVTEISFLATREFRSPYERIGAVIVRFSNGAQQCAYFDEIDSYAQVFDKNGDPIEEMHELHDFEAGHMLRSLGNWTQTSIHAPWDESAFDNRRADD